MAVEWSLAELEPAQIDLVHEAERTLDTDIVMAYAPIGIGAAIGVTVGKSGLDVMLNLAKLVGTLYVSLIVFVLIVGATLALSAVFSQWLGSAGAVIAGAISGFGDAHAPAISAASLAASERVPVDVAVLTALVGFTTNSISKAIVAFSLGTRRYAFELLPGLALMVLAAWGGWMLRGMFA